MTIIQSKKPVFLIERTLIEDGRLSWGSRGLMAFIRSQPDDWRLDVEELINASGDNSTSAAADLEAMIDELLAAGYLKRDKDV